MDNGYHQRLSASISGCTDSLSALLSSSNDVFTSKRIKKSILSKLIFTIPFTVISSSLLSTITSRAYAASTSPVKHFVLNSVMPQPIVELAEWVNKALGWFQNLPHVIGEWSVWLMAFLYRLCGDLILKTPIWIFNNEWFENTTLLFSSISIGIVTTLTVIESIKRMLTGIKNSKGNTAFKPMEFKTIGKRWFIVAGLTTSVPFVFQKTFQGLNWVSEKLIQMGSDTMNAVSSFPTFGVLDVLTLLVFDLILIGTICPILWKNGKRFFDLLILGVISPLALTAWIFDDYRHLFNQWLNNLKHLSLVQVYYALFLLVLGYFIFGVPTPTYFTGMITKMLVVIGGFNRLQSPPKIISRHLYEGGGFDEVTKKSVVDTVIKTKSNYQLSKKFLITNPVNWYKKVFIKNKEE